VCVRVCVCACVCMRACMCVWCGCVEACDDPSPHGQGGVATEHSHNHTHTGSCEPARTLPPSALLCTHARTHLFAVCVAHVLRDVAQQHGGVGADGRLRVDLRDTHTTQHTARVRLASCGAACCLLAPRHDASLSELAMHGPDTQEQARTPAHTIHTHTRTHTHTHAHAHAHTHTDTCSRDRCFSRFCVSVACFILGARLSTAFSVSSRMYAFSSLNPADSGG
jgi:hypothetical protein